MSASREKRALQYLLRWNRLNEARRRHRAAIAAAREQLEHMRAMRVLRTTGRFAVPLV